MNRILQTIWSWWLLAHEVRSEIPVELSAIVDKMLAKDPAKRYQTPAEVGLVLLPFIKSAGNPGSTTGAQSKKPTASLTHRPAASRSADSFRGPARDVVTAADQEQFDFSSETASGGSGNSRIKSKTKSIGQSSKPGPQPWHTNKWLIGVCVASGVLLLALIAGMVIIIQTKDGNVVRKVENRKVLSTPPDRPRPPEPPKPPGDQWFMLEVIAEGNRIVVKVNGQTTADYPDAERRFVRGHITLFPVSQRREGLRHLEFRKIEIKELPLTHTGTARSPRDTASSHHFFSISLTGFHSPCTSFSDPFDILGFWKEFTHDASWRSVGSRLFGACRSSDSGWGNSGSGSEE